MDQLVVLPRDVTRREVEGRALCMAWGFVAADAGPRAAYYVRWDDAAPAAGSVFVFSIGSWAEGASADERRVVALDARPEGGRLAFMVVDAASTPFADQPELGRMCARDEVAGTDLAQAAFLLAETVLAGDPAVPADRLRGAPAGA